MVKKKKAEKAEKNTKSTPEKTKGSVKKPAKGQDTTPEDKSNPLGKKHTCFSCACKFYDFNKLEKICPKCGQDQSIKTTAKTRIPKSKFSEYDILDEEPPILPENDLELVPEVDIDEEPILDEEDV
jgi:PHP family Zn ribbon phosphoesterase